MHMIVSIAGDRESWREIEKWREREIEKTARRREKREMYREKLIDRNLEAEVLKEMHMKGENKRAR